LLNAAAATAAAAVIPPPPRVCRDLSVDDAVELGRRAIYHATFRDCASGGTVSGGWGCFFGGGGEGAFETDSRVQDRGDKCTGGVYFGKRGSCVGVVVVSG